MEKYPSDPIKTRRVFRQLDRPPLWEWRLQDAAPARDGVEDHGKKYADFSPARSAAWEATDDRHALIGCLSLRHNPNLEPLVAIYICSIYIRRGPFTHDADIVVVVPVQHVPKVGG